MKADWGELLKTKHDVTTEAGIFAFIEDCQRWAVKNVENGNEIGIRSIIIGREVIDGKPTDKVGCVAALADYMLDGELDEVGITDAIDHRKDILAMAIMGIGQAVNAVAIVMINEAFMAPGPDTGIAPSEHPQKQDIIFTTLEHATVGQHIWVAKVNEADDKPSVEEFTKAGGEFQGRFANLLKNEEGHSGTQEEK
jgi:hypothetical protein